MFRRFLVREGYYGAPRRDAFLSVISLLYAPAMAEKRVALVIGNGA
jgi:hypothetical protein